LAVDHVLDLKKARDELVKQRRSTASALANGHHHAHNERQLDELIRCQRAIELLDRAIRDEERTAEISAAIKRRTFIRHEDDPYDDIDSLGG
jgi:hypothetical protein